MKARLFRSASTKSVDHSWNTVYLVGGASFLMIGVWYALGNYWSYIFGIPAPGFATPPIVTNEAYFNVLATYPLASIIFYSMYTLAAFLSIPASFAMYFSLKGINKNAMLLAMGLVAVWIFIEVGVTEFDSLTLISLAQSYNAAKDVAQQAAYLTASNIPLAALPIATFYSYFVGSLGFLIASTVMLRGVFRRVVAFIGITCNLLGIIDAFILFAPGLSVLLFPTLNLYGLWNILVGAQLIRLSNKTS
jgi:hypothetical protein